MDTTPEYIKMCEKAIPDLYNYFEANAEQLRPLFIYDYVTDRVSILLWSPKSLRERIGETNDEIIISLESDKDRNIYIPGDSEEAVSKPIVPLWRQDQLQEMIVGRGGRESRIVVHESLYRFSYSNYKDGAHPTNIFDTQEQLWLAFVMKEKYGKVWNGEEWVNNGK